jgi:hypothetical protein
MSEPCQGDPAVDKLILDLAGRAELELYALENGLIPGIKNLNQDSMSELRVQIEAMERHFLAVKQAYRRQMDTLNLQAHGGFQKKS